MLEAESKIADQSMAEVSNFIKDNVMASCSSRICHLDPTFWKALVRSDLSLSDSLKLNKAYFAYKHITMREYVFIYINRKLRPTCAVLVLCGLRYCGKRTMTKLGDLGFGALLFSAEKVPRFDDGLSNLNSLLKLEFESQRKVKLDPSDLLKGTNIFKLKAGSDTHETMSEIFTTLQGLSKVPILKKSANQTLRKRKRALSPEPLEVEPESPSVPNNIFHESPISEKLGLFQETNCNKTEEPHEMKPISNSLTPATLENRTTLDSATECSYNLRKKAKAVKPPEVNGKEPLLLVSDDDESVVEEVFYRSENGEKFPFSQMDLDSLAPSAWLNDSIINFYLQYLLDHSSEEIKKQVYLFSTYFYPRLMLDVKKSSESKTDNVRPWKSEDKIFDFKYTVIPIHESGHWFLAIAVLPSFNAKSKMYKRCRIFVLNSMLEEEDDENEFDYIGKAVNIYLAHEFKRINSKTFPNRLDDYQVLVPHVPQQGNGSDCGLFVLEYFEQFLIVLDNEGNLNDVDFANWFPPKPVAKKRGLLRGLINSFKTQDRSIKYRRATAARNPTLKKTRKPLS